MVRRTLALWTLVAIGCQGSADPWYPPTEEPPVVLPDLGRPADVADAGSTRPDLAGATDFCGATDPRAVAPEVFATPEAGEKPYSDVLARANSSIRVMIYLMGQGAILDALKAKAAAGVSVKVMLDQGQDANQKYATDLMAAGAQVEWSDPKFPYMHAKFFVVDGKEAIVSTGNFSRNYSILLERNFVAHLVDPADVADLVALFDADWARRAPDLTCTRLLVSPVNARARMLALIDSARSTLDIESMQFADSDVRDRVAARKRAGVVVRVLLADPGWITANADAAAFLSGVGIPVKNIPHLHTKMMVVDGAQGYLGSVNLSYTSLSRNREVGIIVTEPSSLRPLVDTFAKDWAAGTSF